MTHPQDTLPCQIQACLEKHAARYLSRFGVKTPQTPPPLAPPQAVLDRRRVNSVTARQRSTRGSRHMTQCQAGGNDDSPPRNGLHFVVTTKEDEVRINGAQSFTRLVHRATNVRWDEPPICGSKFGQHHRIDQQCWVMVW